mgnify:CR=1 FL=1
MARTTQEIIDTMDEEQANQPSLSTLNSPSKTAIYTLWKYIVAQAQNLFEQLTDAKKTEISDIFAYGQVPSSAWIRSKAFEFQYDSTTPQTMILPDNLVPRYETIDASKRIITRAFSRSSAGATTLLVAKNEPPEKLSVSELASIRAYYLNTGDGTNQAVGIGYGGQSIAVGSHDPDLLFMEAEIEYNGQYAATIEADTILAIENFISNVGPSPVLKVVDLVDALQSVAGFSDIFINNLSCRDAATAWGFGTDLILADTMLLSEYTIDAGYMIGETTVGETLADKLTFTAI